MTRLTSLWWLTFNATGGNSQFFKNILLKVSAKQKEPNTWLLCAGDDGSHILFIPLISPTTVGAAPITYQWTRCSGLQESNGNLTLIILHFWFTFETLFDYIRWWFNKKTEKRGEKNKVRIHFRWTWKFSPSLCGCRALQFSVSLFIVKMKIGARSICIWTKRVRQIMNVENVISITFSLFFP